MTDGFDMELYDRYPKRFYSSGDLLAIRDREPIVPDQQKFARMLAEEWEILNAKDWDWRKSPFPYNEYKVRWDKTPIYGTGIVEFYVSTNGEKIGFNHDIRAEFTLMLVRKLVQLFPEIEDNLCFFDEHIAVAVYEPGLTDDELLDRIGLHHLSNKLMTEEHGPDWHNTEAFGYATFS